MSNAIAIVSSFLINSIWQIALAGAVGWLAAGMLRPLGPRVQHRAWVIALLGGVVLPLFPLLRPLQTMARLGGGVEGAGTVKLLGLGGMRMGAQAGAELPAAALKVLLVCYGLFVLYFVLRLLRSLRETAGLLQQARTLILTADQDLLWQEIQQRMGVRGVKLLGSSQVCGPVTLGLLRHVVLVPPALLESCTEGELSASLAHECAHIRRHDFAWNLFYEFVAIFVAFHPVSWSIRRQIACTREILCDRMVTEGLMDGYHYSSYLLRLAARIGTGELRSGHAIGVFASNQLEERMKRIIEKPATVRPEVKFSLILASLLLSAVATLSASALAINVPGMGEDQSTPTSASGEPVNKSYGDVKPPILIQSVEAKFPKGWQKPKKGFSALVVVSCIVDRNGVPQDLGIEKSYSKPFDQEALKAVAQYRFQPAQRSGKPVAMRLAIEINFKLF